MTKSSVLALGRETPYQVLCLDQNQDVLVSYSDGLSLLTSQSDGRFERRTLTEIANNASALLAGSTRGRVVCAGDQGLVLCDENLQTLSTADLSQGESLVSVVAVDENTFLCQDEAGVVTCWKAETDLTQVGQWMVECTPLFSRGKTVICAERGRLQERDPKNGTVLRTWPNQATACWGTSDHQRHHALTLDEQGLASVWDMASRELLFSFATDFQVVRACFEASGLGGALLGLDGEACRFRMTEGGATHTVVSPETTPISLCYFNSELLALDENGGLWSLSDEAPQARGGEWAGWATCSCPLQESLIVGTATGSLETFSSQGQHSGQSLQVHTDAVIGLEPWNNGLLSIGADASVFQISLDQTTAPLVQLPGRTIVDYGLCQTSQKLYLALDEGLIMWISLDDGMSGEVQLEGRRAEEIRPAGPDQAAVLTDRGSVKLIRT